MRLTTPLTTALAILAATSIPAHAATIYLDDFEQFAVGTPLTTLTYTPTIGGIDATKFGAFGDVDPSVTAVSFDASIAAQVDLPVGSGDDYLGRFFTTYVDEVLDVHWRLTTTQTSAGLGGFFVRFPTAEGIPDGMQLLAGFLNDGNIIVFNDLPILGDVTDVGDYTVGVTYDVRVFYDLPGDRYTLFLNGVPLPLATNRAIPVHLHPDAVQQFGFDVSQVMATGDTASQHLFDDVSVQVVPEPGALTLVLGGVAALGLRRGRRERSQSRPSGNGRAPVS